MDPLSEMLSLLKVQTCVSGGFVVSAEAGFEFPKHPGIKCYAAVSGSCWLLFEGADEAVRIDEGDCVLLPQGSPFCLATDLSLPRATFPCEVEARKPGDEILYDEAGECSIVGGHFPLTGSHSELLLNSLPSIVHIRREADKETIRWSLERMREELRHPQPGGSLMAQQLAYTILLQALRMHLREGAGQGLVGFSRLLTHPCELPSHGCTMHLEINGHCRDSPIKLACLARYLPRNSKSE
jgi:Cupin